MLQQLTKECVYEIHKSTPKQPESITKITQAFKEEMIRDRIVIGIRDSSLSETLQMDANLTLEKVKTLISQWEAVHEQQAPSRRGNPEETSFLEFVGGRFTQPKTKGPKQAGRGTPRPFTSKSTRSRKGPPFRVALIRAQTFL